MYINTHVADEESTHEGNRVSIVQNPHVSIQFGLEQNRRYYKEPGATETTYFDSFTLIMDVTNFIDQFTGYTSKIGGITCNEMNQLIEELQKLRDLMPEEKGKE